MATLVRRPSGPECLDMFVADKLEAAAGVRQPIAAFAQSRSDLRLIPGRFMAIEQAMGTLKGREARRAVPAHLHRRDEGLGLRRPRASGERPGRSGGGAAGGVTVAHPLEL